MMNWVLAATLVCGASVFTACSDSNDNPTPKPAEKNRKEFIEHTRASLKAVASNLNFKTWNSVNYFNTYVNKYMVLNDDFDKTLSRTFGQQIQKTLRLKERPERPEGAAPEGAAPEDRPAPEGAPEGKEPRPRPKYVATVDLTDFNYTFTTTQTGFDVAENDDKGLEILVNIPEYANSDIEAISIAIKGTGKTYTMKAKKLSNDSVEVEIALPEQYDIALSTKSGGTWTKNIYGDIKNAVVQYDIVGSNGKVRPAPEGAVRLFNDGWNVACNLHSNIPGVDATDLYFAIGQDPETHKAGLALNYAHNGYKVFDATAIMTNTNGRTHYREFTSSNSIMDVFTAIMAGNSIEDLTLTLLDDLTTNLKVSDCEEVVKLQSAMASARRNYADQKTISDYVDQLNALVSCTMSDKKLGREIPMRLVTTQIGVDWWAVPGLNFSDENGFVPMTELLDKESMEYALNIVDHAVDPAKDAIIVARQLINGLQKLQKAFYDSEDAANAQ